MSMQKEANDFLQQKIDILETQLSLLNNSEMGTLLNNQEVNSFSSALMLASSVKINNIRSEEGEEDEDEKFTSYWLLPNKPNIFLKKLRILYKDNKNSKIMNPTGVPGSSRAVSSQAVSSRGSSQAGSQQELILISSDEDITIKMEKSDTAVTSGISEKGEESAVTSATNEKEDESAGVVTSVTNEKEDVSAVTSATNEKYRGTKKAVKKKILTMATKIPEKPSAIKQREKPQSNQVQTIQKEVIWKYDALPGRREKN
ncbi:hypothetical protein GLOIN_2v1845756 [Rhizophagus irregularis DAOM 181602=DAOM 197198]|nr:hypothetical protein GLOIN_2v1845756 [Rhizophagus irregularis DAOM 181602=DAOM 197198]